jgi:hypothetical protein
MNATAAPLTAAEVGVKLEARRARLEALQAELEAIPATIEARRAALARTIADGATEAAVKKARLAVAELEAERNGLEAAVNLLRDEVAEREAEWRPLHAADLEAEADRLEEEERRAVQETERELKRLAGEFAPIYARMIAAGRASRNARMDALEAAGADGHTVQRAQGKHRLPPILNGDWQAVGVWHEFAARVASYGRTEENSNPNPDTNEED